MARRSSRLPCKIAGKGMKEAVASRWEDLGEVGNVGDGGWLLFCLFIYWSLEAASIGACTHCGKDG